MPLIVILSGAKDLVLLCHGLTNRAQSSTGLDKAVLSKTRFITSLRSVQNDKKGAFPEVTTRNFEPGTWNYPSAAGLQHFPETAGVGIIRGKFYLQEIPGGIGQFYAFGHSEPGHPDDLSVTFH